MIKIEFTSQTHEQLKAIAIEKLAGEMESWERVIWQFIADWFNPEIKTISIYTSGSTGAPKQIEHTKQAMLNSAAATCAALRLGPGMKALLCLPANKIGGIMMIVRCLHNKMDLYCIKPSATPLSQLPGDMAIDFAAFTPMQFHEIAETYALFLKAKNIKKVLLGGEDVRGNLLQSINQLENETYISFGMTETISHIALKRLNNWPPDKYYKLLPGITITTDDRGCLVIKAPALNQPHLITNDLVNIVSATEFEWLGRIDNVINTGGVKIYPEAIEQQMLKEIEYAFFVAGMPDELTGQKLVIVLEASKLQPNETEELKELFNRLDKRERPKEVLLIYPFSRTENGKIKRKETLLNSGVQVVI